MVLKINYGSTYWGTVSSCNLLGGINSTSINQKAVCVFSSNSVFYIKNIAGFLTDPLLGTSTNYRVKFSFLATPTTSSSTANYGITFYTTLYANLDACNANYQGIFYRSNSLSSSCYYTSPGTCYL